MKLLIILGLIALGCWLTYLYIRHCLKNKTETITAYTGGLGSGKTLLSVKKTIKMYRKNVWKYYTKVKLLKKLGLRKNVQLVKPLCLTSIPILLNPKTKEFSIQLTKEHLLLQERLPLHSVVLLDEIGAFASQFDFKEKNVIQVFDEFIRFYRHYTQGGYIVVNDQCSENIVLVVRRRINIVHNLSNCFVFFRHLCWYYDRQITISEEIKTIDTAVDEQRSDTQDNKVLHFCFINPKLYDTYCYSNRYNRVPLKSFKRYDRLKSETLLKCPKDKEQSFEPLTEKEEK